MGQATALKADAGTEIPGEELGQDNGAGTDGQGGERDLEAEARTHGWVPLDEFKGDASRWVDHETFMKRADEMMPLLKAQNARLKRDLESIKKDLKRATKHFEGAEARAYERAKAEIEGRIEEATEVGDVAAVKAGLKELEGLKPKDDAPKHTKEEAEEAFDSFREANPWYDKANLASASELEVNARLYADRMTEKHLDKTAEMSPAEFFDYIAGLTIDKYPQLKAPASRQKPASAVEGGGSGRRQGTSKSWDNLPAEAKRSFERWQAKGILGVKETGDKDKDLAASRAYYARTFDWEGYQQ